MSVALHGSARIALALLTLVAIAAQIDVLIEQDVFYPARFFMVFTIQSNLFAAAVLFEAGRRQLTGRTPVPAMARGAAAVYLTITFVVFSLLLWEMQEQLSTNVPWVDTVLHRLMPAAVVLDWLLDPPRARVSFARALRWLIFPLIWTALTMARGPLDGWYPYPFLDPANGGYATVAIYIAVILAGFLVTAWAAAAGGSALGARRTPLN